MDVLSILVGVLILVGLVMLYVLMDIATSLRIERQVSPRSRSPLATPLVQSAWAIHERPHCECSQESPCMGHYQFYHRWCSGATEADNIGNAITVRLKE